MAKSKITQKETSVETEDLSTNLERDSREDLTEGLIDNENTEEALTAPGITDAAVLGDSIYFIKYNSTLFEKRKDGRVLELFTFPHMNPSNRISIEGFYLGKLVFLILGRLYTINQYHTLELVVE